VATYESESEHDGLVSAIYFQLSATPNRFDWSRFVFVLSSRATPAAQVGRGQSCLLWVRKNLEVLYCKRFRTTILELSAQGVIKHEIARMLGISDWVTPDYEKTIVEPRSSIGSYGFNAKTVIMTSTLPPAVVP
jgi:hypothetical protein